MKDRIAVRFRPIARTRHTYERLKQCVCCGGYTSLWGEICLKCGTERKFLTINDIVRTIVKRDTQKNVLLMCAVFVAAFVLARSMVEMGTALLAGLALIGAYIRLCRRYAAEREKQTLSRMLEQEAPAIREGMLRDIEDAVNDMKSDDVKSAYEKLRETGYLITGNQVKLLKIICLNRFVLRRDMDLELGTLVPDTFDADFILYLHEVCKVSPELVRREVLDYARQYRSEIEALPIGRQTLTQVAGAALRAKPFTHLYGDFIVHYVDGLPRDRLLRLCRILREGNSASQAGQAELYNRAKEAVLRKYETDPEFQGLLVTIDKDAG